MKSYLSTFIAIIAFGLGIANMFMTYKQLDKFITSHHFNIDSRKNGCVISADAHALAMSQLLLKDLQATDQVPKP